MPHERRTSNTNWRCLKASSSRRYGGRVSVVDNTLGRLWFNATRHEQTNLRDRCQCLLVKRTEMPQAAASCAIHAQAAGPACGSMHFGLYALAIWTEDLSRGLGRDDKTAPARWMFPTARQRSSHRQTYDDEAAYLRDVPRLKSSEGTTSMAWTSIRAQDRIPGTCGCGAAALIPV